MSNLSSVDALLQAAQFLEENGRDETLSPKKRSHRLKMRKPSSYSRTTHNLLEKNRRAQLRDCLEVLRQHVPLPDKLTTLSLLQSAKQYIESLQQKEKEENELKVKLQSKQASLLSRLVELGASSVKNASPPPPREGGGEGGSDTPPLKQQQQEDAFSIGKTTEEEDNMVIDVISQESEDESGSISGGPAGGGNTSSDEASGGSCSAAAPPTDINLKYQIAAV